VISFKMAESCGGRYGIKIWPRCPRFFLEDNTLVLMGAGSVGYTASMWLGVMFTKVRQKLFSDFNFLVLV